MPKKPTPALKRPEMKLCRYCRGRFRPRAAGGSEQHFCTPDHRKAYHKRGALPFDKLKVHLERILFRGIEDRFRQLYHAAQESEWNAVEDRFREVERSVRDLRIRLGKAEEELKKLTADYETRKHVIGG